jgi:hypothetical protein
MNRHRPSQRVRSPSDDGAARLVGVNECVWWERVSAAIDNELTEPDRSAAMGHAATCARCSPAAAAASSLRLSSRQVDAVLDDAPLTARERRWLSGRWTRRLLLLAAIVIVIEAVPTYIRGHGLGAEAHAARHLATWQIGFGVGLLVAAWVSRLTHAMLALAATFATLTIVATVIDIVRGHSGPWRESVHLVELVGVFLLWRITPPHLLPWRSTSTRLTVDAPDGQSTTSLRLVADESPDDAQSQ